MKRVFSILLTVSFCSSTAFSQVPQPNPQGPVMKAAPVEEAAERTRVEKFRADILGDKLIPEKTVDDKPIVKANIMGMVWDELDVYNMDRVLYVYNPEDATLTILDCRNGGLGKPLNCKAMGPDERYSAKMIAEIYASEILKARGAMFLQWVPWIILAGLALMIIVPKWRYLPSGLASFLAKTYEGFAKPALARLASFSSIGIGFISAGGLMAAGASKISPAPYKRKAALISEELTQEQTQRAYPLKAFKEELNTLLWRIGR
jgi:hypothetical protein